MRVAVAVAVVLLTAACSGGPATPSVLKQIHTPDQRVSVVSLNTLPTSIGPVVVGEIRNNTNAPLGGVKLTVALKDRGGADIGNHFGSTWLQVVPTGAKASFSITFTGGPRAVGTVSATVLADPSSALPVVSVNAAAISAQTLGTAYEVSGTVTNSATETVHYANVVATFYDKSGNVVGAEHDVTSATAIAPGQGAGFNITLLEQASLVKSYVLAAEAQVVASGK